MRVEIPELKRCCCCLPLRRGLLFWVYLKMVLELLILVYFIGALDIDISRDPSAFACAVYISQIIVFLIDVAFCILFLVSAHRKKHEHMRIYYRYAIVMLIFGVIALLGFIGMEIFVGVSFMPFTLFFIHFMVAMTCFLFIQLVLHAYLIILVRSEVVKLENGSKFEFINHTSEPECKAQIIM